MKKDGKIKKKDENSTLDRKVDIITAVKEDSKKDTKLDKLLRKFKIKSKK